MNTPAQLHLTVTKDNINLEVINLFEKFLEDKTNLLFAVTSDIDNLGIFVARYGRALAQNLVDYCTNILIQFLNSDENILSPGALVLIPAGEEITILGIGSSEAEIKKFYALLNNSINEKIKNFEPEKVKLSITFGCNIISDPEIHNRIEFMLNKIATDKDYTPTNDYYNILYEIRSLVSLSLDSGKFHSLDNSGNGRVIFYRNVVYSEILDYKTRTARILKALSTRLDSIDTSIDFYKHYGLTPEDHSLIKKLYKHLDTD
jgi:hypothetical protein